jgi:hypothetical protein
MDVCDPSGQLPTPNCPSVVKEVFSSGNEPTGTDSLYRSFSINRETGQLATVFTPLNLVDERVFMVPPPEALSWAASSGLPIPPSTYDNIQAPLMEADAQIQEPALFAFINGVVTIKGSANGAQFNNYRLQVGQGLNPSSWQDLSQQSNAPVSNGVLGKWPTNDFSDGLYALRLTVIEKDQTIKTAITQVTIDNTAPVTHVLNPLADQQLSGNNLNLTADAVDETGISRIDWFIDGQLVGTTTQTPYVFNWSASSGKHTLIVKAYDLANNMSASPEVKFSVTP